jgi:hypothetical protein
MSPSFRNLQISRLETRSELHKPKINVKKKTQGIFNLLLKKDIQNMYRKKRQTRVKNLPTNLKTDVDVISYFQSTQNSYTLFLSEKEKEKKWENSTSCLAYGRQAGRKI